MAPQSENEDLHSSADHAIESLCDALEQSSIAAYTTDVGQRAAVNVNLELSTDEAIAVALHLRAGLEVTAPSSITAPSLITAPSSTIAPSSITAPSSTTATRSTTPPEDNMHVDEPESNMHVE